MGVDHPKQLLQDIARPGLGFQMVYHQHQVKALIWEVYGLDLSQEQVEGGLRFLVTSMVDSGLLRFAPDQNRQLPP